MTRLLFGRVVRLRPKSVLLITSVIALLLLFLAISRQSSVLLSETRAVEPPMPIDLQRRYVINFQEPECEMCDRNLVVASDPAMVELASSHNLGEENVQLYRHYTGHIPWPQIQLDTSQPGNVPDTVHYLWCKDSHLGFHHYLSVLSAIRHLAPLKFIFWYQTLPRLDHDMYFSWFIELKQSLPGLVLRPLPHGHRCNSTNFLHTALSFLQQDGGVFLGSNVIITHLPRHILRSSVWFAFAHSSSAGTSMDARVEFATQGIIVAPSGFGEEKKQEYIQKMRTAEKTSGQCVLQDKFNQLPADSPDNAPCVWFPDTPHLYPVNIMYTNTSFGQIARWLFYGTSKLMHPVTKIGDPIPRLSHLIWFSPSRYELYTMELYQFLTILSALYVGGFEHVYIYGNAGFKGVWWDRLRGENVTFVRIQQPQTVYQQTVNNPSHESDVTRYTILHKYGGAYHDFEAMWTMRVPDWILDFPCVATSDWVAYGLFPDNINPGVLMCKRHAPWLRHNMAAHRYYVENNFVWNAVLMSYRTYERHPDQLFFYRHLQVMCDYNICHPSWQPGFQRDIEDKRPTEPFDWRKETLAVHVTRPDPAVSLVSLSALKNGRDMIAEIGRHILDKSGRTYLLKDVTR